MQFLIALVAVLASARKIPREFENPSLRRWLQDIANYGEETSPGSGVFETNVDSGCPANNVRPTFNFRFVQEGEDAVVVINKNLGNRYCSEAAGQADSDYCKTDTPAEILYCNVGFTGEENPEEICLRVTDVGAEVGDENSSPFECDDKNGYEKCGNVLTPNTDFGQIQIEMSAYEREKARVRLRFETLICPDGRDREKGRPSDDCAPAYWLGMVMAFFDIDGNEYGQEELTLHDVFNYEMNQGVDEQDRYDAGFNPCVYRDSHDGSENVPFDRECFPTMKIAVEDRAGVYQYRTSSTSQDRMPNAVIGDVVLRNDDLFDTIPSDENGNYPNPTLVDDLTPEQLKRAVVGFWVSESVLDYVDQTVKCITGDPSCTGEPVFNATIGQPRNSFEVSMGTLKRTIEFAGFSQAISGALCWECGDDGGFEALCDEGSIFMPNRVCRYDDVTNPGLDLAACIKEHCCDPQPTSHGDPIIWTFDNECYDLNKDGLYVATSHPAFDHEVKIAVYNDYMREIQVVDKSGEVMLSINNLGEVINNDYPHAFSHEVKDCPEDLKDCLETYNEFTFDAQDFRYVVQTLQHDYMDAALKEGEYGPHLDIYPQPYDRFIQHKREYTGLYIENPLPEELNYCPGGSPRKN